MDNGLQFALGLSAICDVAPC